MDIGIIHETPGSSGVIVIGSNIEGSSAINESSSKKKPTEFTPDQLVVLERLWTEGMQGYGSEARKKQRDEAKELTGLEKIIINNWIDNKKKKMKIGAGLTTRRPTPSLQPNGSTAWTMYLKKYLKSCDMTTADSRTKCWKKAAVTWKKMVKKQDPQVNEFIEAAKAVVPEQLSVLQQKRLVSRTTRKINSLSQRLKKATETESLFIASHSTNGAAVGGSGFGQSFAEINQQEAVFKFHYAVGSQSGTAQTSRKVLQRQLANVLNAKYKSATGKSAVEYSKVLSNTAPFKVVGWPNGIEFNKPSAFGCPKLKEILAAKNAIAFVSVGSQDDLPALMERETSEVSGNSQPTAVNTQDEPPALVQVGTQPSEVQASSQSAGTQPSEVQASSQFADSNPMTAMVLLEDILEGTVTPDFVQIIDPKEVVPNQNIKASKKGKQQPIKGKKGQQQTTKVGKLSARNRKGSERRR